MRNKNMAVAGGILSIISGVIGMAWLGLAWGVGGGFWFGEEFWVCVVIQLVLSSMAIIGGIFAIGRRMFAVAIIGAICAIMAGGLLFGFTMIMGILALILIVIAKDSFQPYGQPPPQQRYF